MPPLAIRTRCGVFRYCPNRPVSLLQSSSSNCNLLFSLIDERTNQHSDYSNNEITTAIHIKELLIELVTNEITEISTREVVNVLGEPV